MDAQKSYFINLQKHQFGPNQEKISVEQEGRIEPSLVRHVTEDDRSPVL